MLDFIRGIVRPVLAVSSMAATIGFLSFQISIPPEWWALTAGIVGWYFYSRTRKTEA